MILLLSASVGRQLWQRFADQQLATAIERYDEQAVVHWLEAGASANKLGARELDELWPLAAYDDRVVRLMLSRGADVNRRESRWGWTPLLCASVHGTPKAVRLLLRAGATVDVRDHGGFTALMHGTREPSGEIVKDLLAAGADLNTCDPRGSTALMWAVTYVNPAAVKALLARGADTRIRNVDRRSAGELARIGRQWHIYSLLQTAKSNQVAPTSVAITP